MLLTGILPFPAGSEWVARDQRWYFRGPWNWPYRASCHNAGDDSDGPDDYFKHEP